MTNQPWERSHFVCTGSRRSLREEEAAAVPSREGRLRRGMETRQARIGIVSPYRRLAELSAIAAQDFPEPIWVALGLLSEGVKVAREMCYAGVEVIISRGGTAREIMASGIDLPVVSIPISGHDIARAIRDALAFGGPIGVAEYPDMIASVASMAEFMGVEIRTARFRSFKEAGDAVLGLLHAGVRVVIGETLTVQLAAQYGAQSVLMESGIDSVREAIREAIQTSGWANAHRVRSQQVSALAELACTGVVLVDASGRVQAANAAAADLLGMSRTQLVGMDAGWLLDPAKGSPSGPGSARSGGLIARSMPIQLGSVNCGWLVQIERGDRRGRMPAGLPYPRGAKTQPVAAHRLSEIVGRSAAMRNTVDMAFRYAGTDFAVLLCGETGTGKELLAQGIHNASPRAAGPFVAINCAAIPETLLESELFGYEEGAFTGAVRGGKPGMFQIASGGTLFLDEVGSMSLQLQARMLRVLEQGRVWPVGSDRPIPVDVRVIAASNQDLYGHMREGRFREDLFHRLSTLMIHVPPLRDRKEDIRDLAVVFVQRASAESGRPGPSLSEDAVKALEQYAWPGNVRELLNVIRRLVVMSDGREITSDAVIAIVGPGLSDGSDRAKSGILHVRLGEAAAARRSPPSSRSGGTDLRAIEREAILAALQESRWVKKDAARMLGISPTTLWRKLKRWSALHSANKDCVS